MIYITQGHEKGVGLEIFLKSFLLLSKFEKSQITLVSTKQDLEETLGLLKLSLKNFFDLKILTPSLDKNTPASTGALLLALKKISPEDILITLPTSKDQLIFNNKKMEGHTEFFRNYYQNENISMLFYGPSQNILLITDHVPLKNVPSLVSADLVFHKTSSAIIFYKKYFFNIEEVIFSGINPHAGENGLLGTEDSCISQAFSRLKTKFPALHVIGPVSGDTLHHYSDSQKKQLFVYMFHDQALAAFKSTHRFIGLNITTGLPFLRASVDHGTAFDLYGKNIANTNGMLFLFKKIFEVINYVHK